MFPVSFSCQSLFLYSFLFLSLFSFQKGSNRKEIWKGRFFFSLYSIFLFSLFYLSFSSLSILFRKSFEWEILFYYFIIRKWYVLWWILSESDSFSCFDVWNGTTYEFLLYSKSDIFLFVWYQNVMVLLSRKWYRSFYLLFSLFSFPSHLPISLPIEKIYANIRCRKRGTENYKE